MSTNPKKVFDVAAPGTTDPEIGAKPMVIGHSYMQSDSTINATSDSPIDESDPVTKTDEPAGPPQLVHRVIAPLAGEEAEETAEDSKVKSDDEVVTKKSSEETSEPVQVAKKAPAAPAQEASVQNKASSKDSAAQTNAESISAQPKEVISEAKADSPTADAQSEDPDAISNEEQLEEFIHSKRYFVPIKERAARRGTLSPLVTVAVGVVLIGVAAVLVVDAELIDIGIELPFDLIK